jgi:hypothetical protein
MKIKNLSDLKVGRLYNGKISSLGKFDGSVIINGRTSKVDWEILEHAMYFGVEKTIISDIECSTYVFFQKNRKISIMESVHIGFELHEVKTNAK